MLKEARQVRPVCETGQTGTTKATRTTLYNNSFDPIYMYMSFVPVLVSSTAWRKNGINN